MFALHHPRRHAAVRTDEYLFAQLIPYLGNKRKLLHLVDRAVRLTGCRPQRETFVDLFAGSTVVSRWAKKQGFRTVANDWEPYSHQIALGTVVPNRVPSFAALGGAAAAIETLNALPPLDGYIAGHYCPRDDERPDPARERMFFTRANGRRIDAIGEQIAAWTAAGLIDEVERAYLLSALIYAASYASNTSGVFKGFHRGWGGKTATALYRIRGHLRLAPPVLHDNGQRNVALRCDAQRLAAELPKACGGRPAVVYLDPPYNQHPYGSNYHLLNTIALWDKPPLRRSILVGGRQRDKSAIRRDWRTERRSRYNHAAEAPRALEELLAVLDARWALLSYSTDGNIPLEALLETLCRRGQVRLVTQPYKRYRVSTPRYSPRSHNVEFVAVIDLEGRPCPGRAARLAERVLSQERETAGESAACNP
jgi:adenine-specific DNA-methyltransferase